MTTLLVCGNVFDGASDTLLSRTEILIVNGRIADIATAVMRPSMVEVIDLSWLTVMPQPLISEPLPGRGESRELFMMVESGIAAARVLVAATSASAELMGRTDIGVLAPGKRANLIGVAGNPFEDISIVGKPKFVMLDGRIVRRPSRRRDLGIDRTERRLHDRIAIRARDIG